ncbi:MAG: amino acid adenylation domain-containing protein [Acidobacteriota bacterium]
MAEMPLSYGEELSPKQRRLLELMLKEKEEGRRRAEQKALAGGRIPRRSAEEPPLLSFAQQRLWFIQQFQPGTAAYNIPSGVRLSGPLNASLFALALGRVARRHEVLRTTYQLVDQRPLQRVADTVDARLPLIDLSGLPAGRREDEGQNLVDYMARAPFELASAPPWRALLVRLGGEEHVFLAVMHHILSDTWTTGVFFREMAAHYKHLKDGTPLAAPELPIQYADYAVWQRRMLEGGPLEKQVSYWKERFADAPAVLDLPVDRPRPSVPSFRGGRITLLLPDTLTDRLKTFSGRREATLFMTFMAALQTLLYRFTQQDDVLVGTPMANRNRVELEHLIGLFVNTLVLRTDFGGDPTFATLLGRVRETTLEGLSNHDVPFEKVVEELDLERDTRYNPLFQVIFAFQNVPIPKLVAEGLTLERYEFRETTARLDLELDLQEMPDGFVGWLGYNSDLFDASTADRMASSFRRLLEGIAGDPEQRLSELPLLAVAERHQLLEMNDVRPMPRDATLHGLFEARAATHREAEAVAYGDERWSYGELDRRANQLAHRLRRSGVGPEVRVALCFERGLEMVVAVLAVLKADGAYVPLDPTAPPDRIAFLLKDAGADVVLTQHPLRERLPESGAQVLCLDAEDLSGESGESPPGGPRSADQLAYLIYTSGSTGRPKGVLVTHRNAVRLFSSTEAWFRFGEDDVWTLFHSYAFDFSVWELWGAWLHGGRLVVVPYVVSRSPEAFLELLEGERVTVLNQTPTAFRQLQRIATARPTSLALREVIFGGEALDPQTLEPWFERYGDAAPRLVNMYGITETTVHVTYRPLAASEKTIGRGSPIGVHIPDMTVHVLDRRLHPMPLGAAGEICVGGAGSARGYLGRPALTAQRFVPDPSNGKPGARLYRSGDLGRHLPRGGLEHLGRIDHQVKIRGFRIELGEIEAILHQVPEVAEAVVLVRREAPDRDQLVAWVVPRAAEGETSALDVTALRCALAERLPDYMVPSAFVPLDEIPLTMNGKVDRRALPAPERTATGSGKTTAPQNEIERTIAEVWKKVLHVNAVGTHESFFDIGGNSLLLAEVHEELRRETAPEMTLVDLFRYPTISALADFLSRGRGAAPPELERSLARRRRPDTDAGRDNVAVIGMGLRFPEARTPEEYWQNLAGGVHSVRPFSRDDALAAGVSTQLVDDPNYVLAEGSIEDVDTFDHEFFGYQDPAEVELIDPQQRIFLENAWEALERAGYDPRTYDGTIGILGGANISSYLFSNLYENDPMNVMSHFLTRLGILSGNQSDYMCTRIAYLLDLKGPTLAVQSACSTSLVAVHLASEALRRHECDMCLAGGVQIRVPQRMGYMYQEGGFPSPDGYCRSFDARAEGNVHGNGSGVLLLKRLADAVADGDHVYSVLKGSAVVNDGALKVGYSAPGVDGQARAAAEAIQTSGIDAETIGYLEASGTATELGDPLEIEALTQAWRLFTPKTGFCPIGSVKSNIGHLDVASGAAAMIKTSLMLERKAIPPSLHFESPNPAIDFASSPFYVNGELREFPRGDTPRRAAVHAYAVGGTNAHLIFEEAPERAPSGESRPWQLLPLSARSSSALHQATENLRAHLEQEDEAALPDVAYTLQVGRRPFRHRRFALCRTVRQAVEVLREMPPERLRSSHLSQAERHTTFLLPGTPPNADAAAELYRSEPAFKNEVDRCAELLGAEAGRDLAAFFTGGSKTAATAQAEPLLTFVSEVALAQVWLEWGVAPAAVLGCGTGELSAACLAGALPLADALALAAARGRAQETGGRLEVHLSAAELEPYLDGGMALETVLAEALCHVVGPEEAAEDLQDRFNDAGIDCFHLGPAAFLSPAEEAHTAWREALAKAAWATPELPWLSSSTGTSVGADEVVGLRKRGPGAAVALAGAFSELLEDATRVFLEVGTGDLLSATLRRRATGRLIFAALAAGGGLEEEDDSATAQLLGNLGRLWLAGVRVDWQGLARHERRHRRPLPTYPFERVKIWAEPKSDWREIFQAPVDLTTKDEMDRWFYTPSWRRSAPDASPPDDHGAPWLVLNDPDGTGARLAERLRAAGREVVTVYPGQAFARLDNDSYTVAPGDGESYRRLLSELQEAGRRPAVALHLWYLTSGDADASPWAGEEPEKGFWSLLHLARAFAGHGHEPLRLVAVTQGVEEVTGAEELLPARSPFAALVDCLSREMPWISCRHVDVEVPAWSGAEDRLIEELAREVARREAEPRVAYRGRHRWVAGFERLRLEAPPENVVPGRLRSAGVYMVTGGTGRLALVAARFLARATRAKLALVGESGLPAPEGWDDWLAEHGEDDATSRKIGLLRELEGLGAELLLVNADLTSTTALAAAVRRVRERFGTLDGVVHAAGEVSPEDVRGVASIDSDFFQYRLRQRLLSVVALTEALRDEPPELHLLSATLGGVLGTPLAVADNAADAFLAAFARHAGGRDAASWTCVDWDLVDLDETGGSASATAITAAEAEEVLARVLAAPGELSRVMVSTVDLDARVEAARQPAAEPQKEVREIQPRPELETPYAAPQKGAEQEVAEVWAEILGFDRVGARDNFFDLGGNSLLATQLVSRLRERFEMDLALKDFFEEATVARVAQSVELTLWMSAGPEAGAAEAGLEEELGEI